MPDHLIDVGRVTGIDIETELLPEEKLLLNEYEGTIQRGLQTFYAVGEALNAIKVGKLYRAEYATFEDYCAGRWNMTRQHANRTVASKLVVDNLKSAEEMEPIGSILPTTESQTRPLTPLEPEQQVAAWNKAVDIAGGDRPSAAQVIEAVRWFREPSAGASFDSIHQTGGEMEVGDKMTEPVLKSVRSHTPDTLAPDGAEIRVLLDRPQGATRLSLAEALVKPGERTACVSHRTIEEMWFIVRGVGRFHRLSPDGSAEEAAEVAPGDALLIPTGYRFWVENTGLDELVFLCCGTPPWPGPDEAIVWKTP